MPKTVKYGVKRQTDHRQTELNIMFQKYSVINKINKEGTLKVSRTEGRSKGQHIKI